MFPGYGNGTGIETICTGTGCTCTCTFCFSRFFPYKMGNYQRIFDFSIEGALYRSLPYILKKSWKNIQK